MADLGRRAISDRTAEFQAIADGLARRLPARPGIVSSPRVRTRSDFTQMTAKIGADIYATTQKLDKLARLAQSRSLFDDPTVEINELTVIIKQSLSSLNAQLRAAQQAMAEYRAQTGARGRQAESHTAHIVDALKLQLNTAAKGFQEVLQMRSSNIRVQMDRQKQFEGGSRAQGAVGGGGGGGGAYGGCGGCGRGGPPAPLFTPPRALPPGEEDGGAADTVIDIRALGAAGRQAQVQELLPSNYLESRALAVESVQGTLAELGSIFQQLQSVVAAQHEMVERIDAQVEDTVMTVDSTQRQLMRLYQGMSGNRLAIKCAKRPPRAPPVPRPRTPTRSRPLARTAVPSLPPARRRRVLSIVVAFLMLYGFIFA